MNTFPVSVSGSGRTAGKGLGVLEAKDVRSLEIGNKPSFKCPHPMMEAEQAILSGDALEAELNTFYRPMKQRMMVELMATAQIGRLGGLESSRLHQEILMGTDGDICPGDYLTGDTMLEKLVEPCTHVTSK